MTSPICFHQRWQTSVAAIAAQRGYLGKGATPQLEKAARALLQDYRSGALGRVTLETP